MNEITISHKQFSDLCIYAFRYALGRNTAACDDIANMILKHKAILKSDFPSIIRDIRNRIRLEGEFDGMYNKVWNDVLTELES